jgi:twinkle protein
VPTPYDVAGSAHWRNKADNCIAIWRDTAKDTRTVEVHVQKVRKKSVGKVGMATLVYDRVTGQYHDVAAAPPRWSNEDSNYADHGDAPY